MKLKAKAKINLSLDIVGKRADGYHLLSSVFQSIDLYDEVTIEKSSEMSLTCSEASLSGNDNLAFKVAKLMKDKFGFDNNYNIHINKKIPLAAGLAGGSTDAAAVIKGINELENLSLSIEEMIDLALPLGADIPFCLVGGTALVEGIGEEITPIKAEQFYHLLLVNPAKELSTKKVFQQFSLDTMENRPHNKDLINALAQSDYKGFITSLANVLEQPAMHLMPEIAEIKKLLLHSGADYAQMSGSGASVFGIFKTRQQAEQAQQKIKSTYDLCFVL